MTKIKIYKAKDGKEYVLTGVMIERELYEMLLEVAPRFYGRGRGWLSWAVNEALRAWLAPRVHATHANPPRSLWRRFDRVKQVLAEILGVDASMIKECTEKQLDIAIAIAIGSDPRTIKKYKDFFLKTGLIKDVTPHLPPGKKIFEVLG